MVEVTFTLSREQVAGSTAGETWLRAPAVPALTAGKGRPLIAAVGEDEAAFLQRVREALADTKKPIPRLVHPGEDAWWDLAWRWPRPTIEEERSLPAPPDDESALFVNPLRRETWAPHLAGAILSFHLHQHSRGQLLKPRVVLRRADDFDEIEWAELSDALTGFRAVCDPPVPPRPVTRAARMRRASTIGMLLVFPIALSAHRAITGATAQGGLSHRAGLLLFAGLLAMILGVIHLLSRGGAGADREAPRRPKEVA